MSVFGGGEMSIYEKKKIQAFMARVDAIRQRAKVDGILFWIINIVIISVVAYSASMFLLNRNEKNDKYVKMGPSFYRTLQEAYASGDSEKVRKCLEKAGLSKPVAEKVKYVDCRWDENENKLYFVVQNGEDSGSRIEMEGKIIIPEERKSPWEKLMDKLSGQKDSGQDAGGSDGENGGDNTKKQ
jgi:hypothetical protein